MNKQSLLIKGADIHDGIGNVLKGHDVLIEGGHFSNISVNIKAPGCKVLEAEGMEMFPGFVVPLSPWGGAGPALHSSNLSENSSLVTPEVSVSYAFQADGIAYQQLWQWGITTSCLTPDFKNIISGYSAVYKTYANNYEDYLLKDKAFMAAAITDLVKTTHTGKRYADTDMGLIYVLKETLAASAVSMGQGKNKSLDGVLTGRTPLVICCENRDMWQRISGILSDYPDIRYTLCGMTGVRQADLKKDGQQIPYIHFSIADTGWSEAAQVDFEQLDQMLDNGFQIAVSPYLAEAEMSHGEAVLWNAAALYKNGVKIENIVKSICSIPAGILGVGNKIGSIETGKDADFSLWTGNPISSFEARMKNVFIKGNEITGKEVDRYCW